MNIDNILSSESISPYSFYSKRDFGYRTFQKIDHISIDNSIVLFSELPFLEIRDLENENYPMVIEIDDDFQLEEKRRMKKMNSKNSICDIFLCGQTIYLTPWNCRIFFFSQQAIRLANLKCEDSLCNKIGSLFRFELISSNKALELSKILNNISLSDFDFDINELVKDNKINRIKGLLYGYYIGFSKSLPKEIGQLLGIQKRIYNLIASIVSNKNGGNEQFETKLNTLDKEYDRIDPRKKRLRILWEGEVLSRFSSQNDRDEFENILKELKVASEVGVNFAKRHKVPIREITFSPNITNWIVYRDSLSAYTESIINESKSCKTDINLTKYFFIKDDYSTVSLRQENTEMYNRIVAKFFFDKTITIDDLRLRRREITKEIVSEIKSIIESKGGVWDEYINDETRYLKDLQKNIIKNEPFDLQSTPNVFLLSIAAFILKGDDYEALIRYLEENGISEYDYVLGLWGAACGYVDMPKTIFKQVAKSKDTFCETFKSIHYLLLKEKLNGGFPEVNIKSEIEEQRVKKHVTFNSRMNEQIQPKENKEINIKEGDPDEKQLRKKLKQEKIKEKQIDSIIEVWKNNHFLINEKLLVAVSKSPGIGKTTIEKIRKILFDNTGVIKFEHNPTLFDTNLEKNIIDNLSCLDGVSKDAISRLKENWNFVERDQGKTAKEKISYFINLCKKEGDGRSKKQTALLGVFTEKIANICKKDLENLIF